MRPRTPRRARRSSRASVEALILCTAKSSLLRCAAWSSECCRLVAAFVVGARHRPRRCVRPSSRPPKVRSASPPRTGDLPVVQALLASGTPIPNAPDGPRGIRALATASRAAQLETMSVLVSAGANPNLPDAGGNRWVPLQHAVHKHRTASVAFLLDHGARPGRPGRPTPDAAHDGCSVRPDRCRAAAPRPWRQSPPPQPTAASVLDLAVSGGALTDIDEPLLGACHTETVRLLIVALPGPAGRATRCEAHLSALFARLNGCGDVLRLVQLPGINREPLHFRPIDTMRHSAGLGRILGACPRPVPRTGFALPESAASAAPGAHRPISS